MKKGTISVQEQELDNVFMKGCYFFHGDIELNKCQFSKNASELFDVQQAKEDNSSFWENFVDPKDYFLFQKFFNGKRSQICGDFHFKKNDGKIIMMQCILQREDMRCNQNFSGVLTELSLGYSTKSVSRLKESNSFRAVLDQLCDETREYGILIIGIDNFKDINEFHSYVVGDEVLRVFSQRIEETLREDISLYQLDGDGFGILYPEASLDDIILCFEQIKALGDTFKLSNGISISFTLSAGIAMYPKDGKQGEMIYRNARVAYNEAKARGKNQFVLYNEEISERASYLAKLMESLKESIQNNFEGFHLHYQPLISSENNSLSGCEALLRWNHKNFPNGISPVEFIPLLEKSSLIIEVGRWVLDAAFQQKQKWDNLKPDLQMNINVAACQFRDPTLMPYVMERIAFYNLDPHYLTLELTESGEIKDTEEISKVFDFFRSQHLKIALDDFGTGYDSLNSLRLLSSDVLKIDRSFLERITYNIADQKILYNIINLCKSMKIDVCIEGVETSQVNDISKEYGAKLLQGFYYSKPVPPEEFEMFILGNVFNNGSMQDNTTLAFAKVNSFGYSEVRPAQAMNMGELVDQAHGAIFQVGMDREFTFLTCNEGYRRMLGYTAKEIEEKFANKALGFVHPDDVDYVNEEVRQQLSVGDTLHSSEFRIVRKDGTSIWVVATGSVVRSHKRNPSLVVMILENDTAKKQSLKYQSSYLQFQKILNNIPGGIKCVRFDEFFTIDYISPSFLTILGYKEEDVITQFDSKYSNMIYDEDVIKVTGDVLEQLKSGDIVTLRYRSYCKDGSLVWLETVSRLYPADEDGIQRFYSSVINVTDTLRESEKQRTLNFKERFQLASKHWGDVLFDVDLTMQYINFSEYFKELFDKDLVHKLDDFYSFIHQEDQVIFRNAIQEVQEYGKVVEDEIRIKDKNGNYIYCSIIFNEPDHINGKPLFLFGKLRSIEKERKEREHLIQKTEIDSVTKLLNKGTIESRIRNVMDEDDTPHALYMIDIDDFKQVNDKLGHLFGDKLLREVAKRLQSAFESTSMIGRAGGDEFMVFSSYGGNLQEINEKATSVIQVIQQPFSYDGKTHLPNVSIGIAKFPENGLTFYDLFKNADSALYRVKQQNKNDYSVY